MISHNKKKIKSSTMVILLIVLLLISSLLGIIAGSVSISLKDTFDVLRGNDVSSTSYILIKTVRFPRVLGGLIAGIGLSSAGVILQGVMNNALASPNTIGVNSGAGFAVMIAMVLFPGSMMAISVLSFVGALLTTLIIFALAYVADRSRVTIILAGITVSSVLSAAINTVKLLDTDITINITSFMIGSLSGLSISKIFLPGVLILISLIIALMFMKSLNILSMGDDIARSLGMNVNLNRFILLILSSVMAGAVVSFAGLLGFVGLIVPHICRKLFGNDARILLPSSALLGGSFVILSDLIGRIAFAPFELPVGIIMSFVGGPFFLYLLMRKKGGKRVSA